ncbi:MAG: energy-coupled thiamine transporter ThiT [Emergencia sp.]|jgi:thiamine transporter|uniref:energy-coupled thiamine transporter ThiT n=1 Tax=Anaerovoracaceae TaxID=543314 RepID=UPI00137B5C0D|nr:MULTISPECIES: energy-coupled thiamine transporter ThiT [Clostridia]MCI9476452.1 energy-coupled thiamine transporter ThiT [Emergencia sp.]NCE97529.1 energy-coupled thiamine transporter ThiT [Emergencia sp. 1XD21-10]
MFKNMQGFFESTIGHVVIIAVIVVFFALILIPSKEERENKSQKPDAKALTISALLAALALGLGQLKLFEMPFGGTVTVFSMLPLALCGYFLGTRRGVICGFVVGLLNLLFSPYVIHPVQLLVDYPFAFGALGLAGVFKDKKNGLAKGYVLGLFVRYICAALSGIVFFGSYAPEGFNAVTWSLWYNFTYLAAEGILTLIIISLSPVKNAFEGLKKSL